MSALLAAAAAPRPSEAGAQYGASRPSDSGAQYGAPRPSEAGAGLAHGASVEAPSTALFEEEATDEESVRTVGALRRELLHVRHKARKLMEEKDNELGRLKSTLSELHGRAEKAESALREALSRHEVERIEMHQQTAARIATAERSSSDAAQAAAAAAAEAAAAGAAGGASSSTAAPEAATADAATTTQPPKTPETTPVQAAPPYSLLVAPPLSLLSPVHTDIGSGLSSTLGLMQLAQQQAMRDAQMRDHDLELAELRARLASADEAYENLRREMRELEMRSRRGGASMEYVKCLVLQLLQVSVVNCILIAASDCL